MKKFKVIQLIFIFSVIIFFTIITIREANATLTKINDIQQRDFDSEVTWGYNSNYNAEIAVGQKFKPNQNTVDGVSIYMKRNAPCDAGNSLSVDIFTNAWSGVTAGTVNYFTNTECDEMIGTDFGWVDFDLATTASVIIGDVYRIQLRSGVYVNPDKFITKKDSRQPYADGNLYYVLANESVPDQAADMTFKTYSYIDLDIGSSTYNTNSLFDFFSNWYTGFTNLTRLYPTPYFINNTEERFVANTKGLATSTASFIFRPEMKTEYYDDYFLEIYDYVDDTWTANNIFASSTISNLVANNSVTYGDEVGLFYVQFETTNNDLHKYRVRLKNLTSGHFYYNKVYYLVASSTLLMIDVNNPWIDPVESYTEGGYVSTDYGTEESLKALGFWKALMTRKPFNYFYEFASHIASSSIVVTTSSPVSYDIGNASTSLLYFHADFGDKFYNNNFVGSFLVDTFRPLLMIIIYIFYGIFLYHLVLRLIGTLSGMTPNIKE